MAPTDEFKGFSEETVKFFRELTKNNTREWFTAQRRRYDEFVLRPAQAFVESMGGRLRRLTPGIAADPRPDGSLFRIYRDTRFSQDKAPYKTHMGIFFWEGKGPRLECSGYYFHLEPPRLLLGGGIYIFPRPLLERFRQAALDPEYGAELAAIIKKIIARPGFSLDDPHYKRLPPGTDPAHPNAGLLLHNGLYAGWETNVPVEFYSASLIDYCYDKFRPLQPLHRWLTDLRNGNFDL
ncbi:MAG: DUF2461 domain-containing protein [Candidatus Aminicenantes bacterium]|nr:DUF2461 domain-containing protein [Candidatus Aminicenantes bacterium]